MSDAALAEAPRAHVPSSPTGYEGHDLEVLSGLPRYQAWIVESFRDLIRGRVLEVGAGIGSIARFYAALADEAVLLEPAANLTAHLRENMRPFPNAKVVTAMLEDVIGRRAGGCDFSRGSFDACIMVNVLEHIDDDVATLRALHGLLRPGGSLILFVPALSWLFGSLDALHHHKRRYSRPTLATAVRRAEFEIDTLRYFDVLGVLPWFVAGRVLRQQTFDPDAVAAYDRIGVPIGAAIERLISPPFGKNLLCLARKR